MSTLRKQEPVGPGIRRIACAQVESAIRLLTRQPGQAGKAHQAIRVAQAMLALIEPDLPKATVRRDRALLARLATGLDEITRPERLLNELNKQHGKSPDDDALAAAVKALRKKLATLTQSDAALSSGAGSFNPLIYRLVADMAEVRGHMGEWPTEAVRDDAPPRGLRQQYTKARRLAGQDVTPDGLAELLAALALLVEQVSTLNKACPPMLKAHRKLLSKAIDPLESLHTEHALDQALREQLGKGAKSSLGDKPALAKSAAAIIDGELSLVLAETPAGFMNRLQVYWTAWRSDAS